MSMGVYELYMGVGTWFEDNMDKTRQLKQASHFICPQFLLSIIQNIFNCKCCFVSRLCI